MGRIILDLEKIRWDYTERLLEKRGVLNHYNNSRSHADYILNEWYNEVREYIIEMLNQGMSHSFNFIKEFSYDYTTHIGSNTNTVKTDVLITYNPTPITTLGYKMKTVDKKDSNTIILSINIDIFNSEFKPTFFHELQHIIQICGQNKTFSHTPIDEYLKLLTTNTITNISLSQNDINLLKTLFIVLYVCNPMEYNAHREQIYNETYLTYNQVSNINYNNELVKLISQYKTNWNLDNTIFIPLMNEIKTNKNIYLYFWYLFIYNHKSISNQLYSGSFDTYKIFPKHLYNIDFIKELFEDSDNETQQLSLIDFSVYTYNLIFNSNTKNKIQFKNEFINGVIASLKWYKRYVIKSIQYAIETAFSDIQNNKKILCNYVIDPFSSIMKAEIKCEYDENYITYIKGKEFKDLYKKKYILEELLSPIGFVIEFGFADLETSYLTYIDSHYIKVPFIDTSNINIVQDIDIIIKQL